ncbi:MAG: SUMF1/EgtB/PvdO family nonheme iron enzyme, partial [Bacteroidota bacterium]
GSEVGNSDETPFHKVKISTFYISKFEVTQKQYEAIMEVNPSMNKNCPDCPVENVSYQDVQKFLKKLNGLVPENYRLPTEAEWEYAAKGGHKSNGSISFLYSRYSGSNTPEDVAWFSNNSDDETHPIGRKAPNELDIYDMSGNVWEWCSDWYESEYYKISPYLNPKGPASGSAHVFRGGCYRCDDKLISVSKRNKRYFQTAEKPANRGGGTIGFRVCLSK